jgi:peptidyl-prolyl cis-trans isomerase SurA
MIMQVSKILVCWVTGLLIFLGSAALVRADTVERIVAVVNGDIILYGDLQEQVKLLEKLSPNANLEDPAQRARAEREILNTMIRQRLAEQEAKRLKITVNKGELDKAFEEMKRENGFTDAQLELALGREGQTVKQFRDKIRLELERARLMERVVKSKIVISEAQIDARLGAAPPELQDATQERRRLAVIFLPVPENAGPDQAAQTEKLAHKIQGNLKDGADFAKTAREYSQGPGAQEGGEIGYVSPDEMAPEMSKAIKSLTPGGMSDVIQAQGGFYILKVLDVRKEQPTDTATVTREKVRKQLYQDEVNRKYEAWIKELEAKAFIKVSL